MNDPPFFQMVLCFSKAYGLSRSLSALEFHGTSLLAKASGKYSNALAKRISYSYPDFNWLRSQNQSLRL